MATRYPSEWIEELRQRADILSIISETVPLKQKGRSYWGLCPFHGEKTPSFKVDPDQGLYYCFGCKKGGTVFQFVMETERMEFAEAVRYLADKVRMPLPEQEYDAEKEAQRRSVRERIYELNRKAAHIYHETLYAPEGARVLEYLHGRGLDDPAIRVFGLGAAPSGWDTVTRRLTGEGATVDELVQAGLTVRKEDSTFDMFRSRAIFPIISAHGQVLGFGGRAMGDAQPKYLNTADTPAFNKRQNVYAANLLKKTRGLTRVLLVEGYMDVVSLMRHGIKGVAATLGTSLTPEQTKLLGRYAKEIWIAYDGDSAGQNATLRALDIMQGTDVTPKVLVIPNGLDPDDFIRQNGREAFEALKPMSAPMYRMQRAKEGFDLSGEDGRTQYAMAAAAILRSVSQPVELENLLKRLIIETGYSREVLIQQVGVTKPQTPARVRTQPREPTRSAPGNALPGENFQAERVLLSLMSAGRVSEDTVDAERFTDSTHRRVAEGLLDGKTAAELLDGSEDEDERREMLEVFSYDPQVSEETLPQVVADCSARIHQAWIARRLPELMEALKITTDANEKAEIFTQIHRLNKEKERLRPGRKE